MKTKIAAFLIALVAFASLASALPNPIGDVVKDMPGYGIDNQCLPFARAACAYLKLRGFKAEIVSFRFQEAHEAVSFGLPNYAPTPAGRVIHHAVVIFDYNGERFGMDNFWTNPQRVAKVGQNQSNAACIDRWFPNFLCLTNYK